jgi:hypothetical protein
MRYALALFLALSIAPVSGAQSQPWTSQQVPMTRMSGLLRLVETIPVPTEGYMDRMAADVKGQRLFICGEAAKSLLVVDLRAGKVIHETKGLAQMPKKAFYLPDSNEIWLTLTNSTVLAISGTTYEVTKTVELSAYGDPNRGADNAAYDPARHLLYAGVESFVSENNVEKVGAGPMSRRMPPSRSSTRAPQSSWEASSCRAAIHPASPWSHPASECLWPWEMSSAARAIPK